MTGSRSIVCVRNVSKRFGNHCVLDGFNFEVRAGEKVAIIGPSGSGKSTLLRILMTLEGIDRGELLVDGEYLWRDSGGKGVMAKGGLLRTIRGKIGMVFQQFNLFPHMTALRNVAEAPRRVLNLSRGEADQRATEMLALVGLSAKESAFPAQLSGGQQQRVAIARALAMRPQILLFDEVTSALDPELVGEVLNVIRGIARTTSCTMLMVTHQMAFAREFADRVCFLEGGRVIEEGSPGALFETPANDRTRSFLRAVLQT